MGSLREDLGPAIFLGGGRVLWKPRWWGWVSGMAGIGERYFVVVLCGVGF